MSNLIFGILTITLCAICYYFSWRYRTKDNYKLAIILLIICGLTLRIFTSADFFLHSWDERYHALVAKNMIHHPMTPTLYDNPVLPYDYKNWTGNHVWLHKPPLPLWTMAICLWLFGISEIALRIPSIILTTIGIWLTFFIGSYFFNKKVGYLSAFFFSVNGLIIELTGGRTATDHIDIFFLFFIELAIFFSIVFAQKKKTIYNVLAGISLGAAILSKWLPALIVLPVWLLIIIDSGNFKLKSVFIQFIIFLMTCIVIFLPWQIYIYRTFPLEASWEAGLNFRHFTEVQGDRTGPFYYFFDKIRMNYGELIYLPFLWFLWKTIKNCKELKRLAISIWCLIPVIFFSFAKTKMQGYILFTSPALFFMTAEFFFFLSGYKNSHKPKWIFNVIFFLLIALPIRYMIERTKPFQMSDRNPQWVSDLKQLNEKKIKKGVLFNYDKPVEAMFYTNLTVYQGFPDNKTINDLIEKGYIVMINDNGNIPKELSSINGVIIEKLANN
ncbi:MAG: glycosyltransferase family 39 protein [Bacteroidia bacterium]|nr:glycosyltransferase family 39 protein [Bacteroidia bacterium]